MARNFCTSLHSHSGQIRLERISSRISFVALGLLFLAAFSFAQGNSGSIEGVVKDPSGSSIAGATVEITIRSQRLSPRNDHRHRWRFPLHEHPIQSVPHGRDRDGI